MHGHALMIIEFIGIDVALPMKLPNAFGGKMAVVMTIVIDEDLYDI
jgi:hypothetical protein